jgi:hypothetical protein
MKLKAWLSFFVFFAFALTGCGVSNIVNQSTPTELTPLTATVVLPSSTPSSNPTQIATPIPTPTVTVQQRPTSTQTPTITLTPLDTLEPEVANEQIRTLLREPVDCAAPCVWGIMPGFTTSGEARNIFAHLGLQMGQTNSTGNSNFYEIDYKNENGLYFRPILEVQNDKVININIYIEPEKQKMGIPRDWSAYSPEILIHRYGEPSKVTFILGRGANATPLIINMYFDTVNVIVDYEWNDLGPKSLICPLTDQIDAVAIWIGKNPQNPPLDGVPLKDATSKTLETFSKLMTGNPDKACFNLKVEAFP